MKGISPLVGSALLITLALAATAALLPIATRQASEPLGEAKNIGSMELACAASGLTIRKVSLAGDVLTIVVHNTGQKRFGRFVVYAETPEGQKQISYALTGDTDPGSLFRIVNTTFPYPAATNVRIVSQECPQATDSAALYEGSTVSDTLVATPAFAQAAPVGGAIHLVRIQVSGNSEIPMSFLASSSDIQASRMSFSPSACATENSSYVCRSTLTIDTPADLSLGQHTISLLASAGQYQYAGIYALNVSQPPPFAYPHGQLRRIVAAIPNQTNYTLNLASQFNATAVYLAFRTSTYRVDMNEPIVADTQAIRDAGYKVIWGLDWGGENATEIIPFTFDYAKTIRWFDAAQSAGVIDISVLMMPRWNNNQTNYDDLTRILRWMNSEAKMRGMSLSYYFGDNLASNTDGIDCTKLMAEDAITLGWVAGGWTKSQRPGCAQAQGANFWAETIAYSGGLDNVSRRVFTNASGMKLNYDWVIGGPNYLNQNNVPMGVGVPHTLLLWAAMNMHIPGYNPIKSSQLVGASELAGLHDSDLAGINRTRLAGPYMDEELSPTDCGATWDVGDILSAPIFVTPVPKTVTAGGPGFNMTVHGCGFMPDSVFKINNSARTTMFVSEYKLITSILASDISSAGSRTLKVVNPSQGNATSNSKFLTVG